jgi:peptide deformylase
MPKGVWVMADGQLGRAMRALGIVQLGTHGLDSPCSRLALPAESVEAMRVGGRLFARLDRVRTVHSFTSGLGLSAPQLGVSRAAVVVHRNEADPIMLFNPRVVAASRDMNEEYEGCLSFFDVRGLVARPRVIEVEHQTSAGAYVTTTFEGGLARLVAHEIDHLRGIFYTDRMAPGLAPISIRDRTS